MARGKKAKIDTRGPLQRLHDGARTAAEQSELDVITPEMRAKGTYIGLRTIVNNHDPVERWKAAGKLSQPQQVVIEMCQRLWNLAGLQQRVTASYGESVGGAGDAECNAAAKIDARDDLHRFKGYFPAPLDAYWSIYENCCRHGMPAGVAGGDDRNGAHKAYLVTCFVADTISTREGI